MNKTLDKSFGAALLSIAIVMSSPVLAKGSTLPTKPEVQSGASQSVQPQVEKKVADEGAQKRKKLLADATATLKETEKALEALDAGKTDEALQALALVTGKLELIVARDPKLALAPVSVEVATYDLLASPDTIKAVIQEAEGFIEDGKIQQARPLVANLASEMVFRTTNIPLATYPAAIKAITPLIDAGKLNEARTELQAALNTLVVTTDEIIPLPKLRAEHVLIKAEKLAENKERTEKDNETLARLLKEARNQLKIAQLLGYGDKKAYKSLYEQIDTIEKKTGDGKSGKGWFNKIKKQVSEIF
jgi:hypothetical protein